MVKLNKVFKPSSLDDIVGQPVETLKQLLDEPSRGCWMLVGDPGTGKTITTRLVADSLGCTDEFTGLHHVPCTLLGIEDAKTLFLRDLSFCSPSGFHLVILEECEFLSPQVQRFLKDALDPETNLRRNTIVMGTSNKIDGLDEALIERFRILEFSSNKEFAGSCYQKIRDIWEKVTGYDVPPDAKKWGWKGERFSMRLATQQAEDALAKEFLKC